jgi:chitinase
MIVKDLHGSWENITGINSPLKSRVGESDEDSYLNIYSIVNYWLSKGLPKNKLIVGLATYGRTFTLKDDTSYGLGASAIGPGKKGQVIFLNL